jgi:hypothetical protein
MKINCTLLLINIINENKLHFINNKYYQWEWSLLFWINIVIDDKPYCFEEILSMRIIFIVLNKYYQWE